MRCRRLTLARGFTLVELLVVIAIIGVLVSLLLPAVNAARESGRRAQCSNNLHNLALALANYHAQIGSFPPAMTFMDVGTTYENPATSEAYGKNWVIQILPFLDQQVLYSAFNFSKAISDPVNRDARGTELAIMKCPSDSAANRDKFAGMDATDGDNWARGNYGVNACNEFVNATTKACPGWTDITKRGVMGSRVAVRIDDITDGSSNTLMIGELRAGMSDNDSRGVWAMGIAGASSLWKNGFGGDDQGPNAHGQNLGDDLRGCQNIINAIGADRMDREQMSCWGSGSLAQQATTRSRHPGGVMTAFADGSVHFISDSIETSWLPDSRTSAAFGSVWDKVIASADGQRLDMTQVFTD